MQTGKLFVFTTFWFLLYGQENVTEESSTQFTKNLELRQRMVTPCTTPNGDISFCMPFINCTKLYTQLENEDAKEFLRNSTCGPKNGRTSNPLVCCGKYANFKTKGKNPLPKTCGYQNVTIRGRILGGKNTVLGEFPWMARLIHRNQKGIKSFACGGFLIAPKFVVTAGHCLESENIVNFGPIFEVHLGEHNTKTKIDCNAKNTTCADIVQVIRVNKTIVHPSYNMTSRHHHHDIGLIYLKKGVKYTTYVYPICLLETYNFEIFEYWLAGWGSTESESVSDVKLKVSVPPFFHTDCKKKYSQVNVRVVDHQICAGGKRNKDSCTGDSGGPLMVVKEGNHWFAAGVVSYGMGCGEEGWPAIYTNITFYCDWIRQTMLKYQKPKTVK